MIPNSMPGGTTPRPNPTYPMARLTSSTYAAPLNYNQPTEVIGGYDAKINPMTGEEIAQTNFARGGSVAPEAGVASLLASRGRSGDTMLVHMAPEEVRGLQSLALAHGGSLTINPHTGLYEASFLKKLLPTLLGFGLNALFPGLGAIGSSLLVGGVEAARTGDLSKGLMAGLGAYGGASLGSAVSTAGATAGEAAKTSLQAGVDTAAQGAGNVAANAVPSASNIGALSGSQAIKAAGTAGTDAITKAFAPEAFKSVAAAPITGANLSSGMAALQAAPGATLKAVGSRLGAAGVAGLGSTASNLMTPELKPYDPEDPTFYISGGYDPERGFLPGTYTKKYPGMASGGSVARYAAGGASFAGREDAANPDDYISLRSYAVPTQYGAAGYGVQALPTAMYMRPTPTREPPEFQPPTQQPPVQPPAATAPKGPDPRFYSAANQPYSGSGAEQLSSYMQNLNRSFMQAPKPPKPVTQTTTPATGTGPTQSGLGAYADILRNLGGLSGAMGMNFDPSMFTGADQRGSSGDYSKPLFRMTADEVAAEDAARQAAQPTMPTQPSQPSQPYQPSAPIDYGFGNFDGIDYSGINPYAANYAPADQYTPPAPSYTPPQTTIEPEYRDYIPGGEQQEFLGTPYMPEVPYTPVYNPPAPSYQPPAYNPPAPSYEPPVYAQPMPETTPVYEQAPSFDDYVSPFSGGRKFIPEMGQERESYTPPAPQYTPPTPQYTAPAEPQYTPPTPQYTPSPFADYGNYDAFMYGMPPASYDFSQYEAPQQSYSEPAYSSPAISSQPQEPQYYGLGKFGMNYDPYGNEYDFGFAKGGVAKRGRKRKQRPVAGKLVSGRGDGMSDSIKANIDGDQEARLTDGEFVIPADVVSHLGNGSTDAGSKKLYDMMSRVRKARTGRAHQAPQVNVDGMMPR